MNVQPAISIIIPAYNAAPYLEVAMQSLRAQTFQDFEVIIIEDCSNDEGATMREARRIASLDPRVRIGRTKVNSGISITRNVGLDMASGDYVTFLDADDQFTPEALQKLHSLATRHNADVVCCCMESIFPDGTVRFHVEGSGEQVFTDPDEITEIALNVFSESVGCGRRVFHMPTISRLIRRQLLEDYGIRFPDVPHLLSEDMPFIFASMRRSRVFVYTDDTYYRYLQHPASLTHAVDPEMVQRALRATSYFADVVRREPDLPPYAMHNVYGYTLTWLRSSLKMMFTAPGSLRSKRQWMLRQTKSPFFETIYRNFPWREMPVKHRLGFICFYKKRFLPLYAMVVGQEKLRRLLGKA